jgi:hypothetical protein
MYTISGCAAIIFAACSLSRKQTLDSLRGGSWNVVKRHGKLDVLRLWINTYICEEGPAWAWSPESARETVRDLIPFARSIGLDDLADYAEKRASKLIVGYGKDTSLARIGVHDRCRKRQSANPVRRRTPNAVANPICGVAGCYAEASSF